MDPGTWVESKERVRGGVVVGSPETEQGSGVLRRTEVPYWVQDYGK